MLTGTTTQEAPMGNVCDMDFSVGVVNGEVVNVDGVAYDVCPSHAGYLSKATTVA